VLSVNETLITKFTLPYGFFGLRNGSISIAPIPDSETYAVSVEKRRGGRKREVEVEVEGEGEGEGEGRGGEGRGGEGRGGKRQLPDGTLSGRTVLIWKIF
jgi:hypothetical protein